MRRANIPALKPYDEYSTFAELLKDLIDQTTKTPNQICNEIDKEARAAGFTTATITYKTLQNWLAGKPVGFRETSRNYLGQLAAYFELHRDVPLHLRWMDLEKKTRGKLPPGTVIEEDEEDGNEKALAVPQRVATAVEDEVADAPVHITYEKTPRPDVSTDTAPITAKEADEPIEATSPFSPVAMPSYDAPRRQRPIWFGIAAIFLLLMAGTTTFAIIHRESIAGLFARLFPNPDAQSAAREISLQSLGLTERDWATESYDAIVRKIDSESTWSRLENDDSPLSLTLRCFRAARAGEFSRADLLCQRASDVETRALIYLAARANGFGYDKEPTKALWFDETHRLLSKAVSELGGDYSVISYVRWSHQRNSDSKINILRGNIDDYAARWQDGTCNAALFDALLLITIRDFIFDSERDPWKYRPLRSARIMADDCESFRLRPGVNSALEDLDSQIKNMTALAEERGNWIEIGANDAAVATYFFMRPQLKEDSNLFSQENIGFLYDQLVNDGTFKVYFAPSWADSDQQSPEVEFYYAISCLPRHEQAQALINGFRMEGLDNATIGEIQAFFAPHAEGERKLYDQCITKDHEARLSKIIRPVYRLTKKFPIREDNNYTLGKDSTFSTFYEIRALYDRKKKQMIALPISDLIP